MKSVNDNSEIKTNQLVTALFDENLPFSYVCKKTEKLTSALHLITDVIDKEEPVCRLLRQSGLRILSGVVSLGTQSSLNNSDNVKSRIVETVSLLGVAYRSGFISEANHTLLEAEYIELGIFVDTHKNAFSEVDMAVSKELLNVPYPKEIYQRDVQRQFKRQPSNKIKKSNGTRHSERREAILKLFEKKDKIIIKDVSKIITNCSEKTLQRELISLVDQGVLKKEGERRWSAYFLVK